jgi:hypothetical protein
MPIKLDSVPGSNVQDPSANRYLNGVRTAKKLEILGGIWHVCAILGNPNGHRWIGACALRDSQFTGNQIFTSICKGNHPSGLTYPRSPDLSIKIYKVGSS